MIGPLEDPADYRAFEQAVTTAYDAETAVERELVLRLASLLWRLSRATSVETGLLQIQARHLLQFRQRRRARQRPENTSTACTDTLSLPRRRAAV